MAWIDGFDDPEYGVIRCAPRMERGKLNLPEGKLCPRRPLCMVIGIRGMLVTS